MKKIISIILTLVIITSCVAVGTISSSAATVSMRTKTQVCSSLYEGKDSHMKVSLNCDGNYIRIDDLNCMQDYITYKSSNKSKVFVTVSGKIVCFDDTSSVTLTSYLKVPNNYYEHKCLLEEMKKESFLRYVVLRNFLYRGKKATSSVTVGVKPMQIEGFANFYGATAHRVTIKPTTANTIVLNLSSTNKKKANGLISIKTPCASTLRWSSSNKVIIDGRYNTKKPGITVFGFKTPRFNGSVKIYLKDCTGNTLRTIKINHKYIV
ncbi:MAG: hypothetical protein ACI4QE_00250 [Acutalibacteraceae bacterium]